MERQIITRNMVEAFARIHLAETPDNIFSEESARDPADVGHAMFASPLVCIGSAEDPLWDWFKAPGAIGPVYRTPREWLPGAKTVISIFGPWTDYVRQNNAAEPVYPGSAWAASYDAGGALIKRVGTELAQMLQEAGYQAMSPTMDKEFRFIYAEGSSPDYPELSYVSNWSERHAAFVCGQGSFGLSRGIITRRGMAGRFTSVVTDLELEPDERPYEGLYDYCSRCGCCIANCPAKAISFEKGKEHPPCDAWLTDVKKLMNISGSCGKCQVNVPCMDGIPAEKFRHLTLAGDAQARGSR